MRWALALGLVCIASCGRKSDAGYANPDAGGSGSFDQSDGAGIHPCTAAQQTSTSVGCEYYAIHMDGNEAANNGCFVTYVANTSDARAHLDVTYLDEKIDLAQFAKLPRGS